MKKLDDNRVKWVDKHPILYVIVTTVIAIAAIVIASQIFQTIGSIIVMIHRGGITRDGFSSLGMATTVIKLVSYVIVLLIFWFKFRKELSGFFSMKGLGMGILFCWSELAISAFLLINGIIEHEAYGNFWVALISGAQPGVSEEILLRIIPLAIIMRSSRRERLIVPAAVFTSILFGLFHGINILAGANPVSTLFQVIYSACVGLLFAAVYLRTGNLWISITLHTLTDVIYYINAANQGASSVMSQGCDINAAIFYIICAALYLINALYIFRKSKRTEIPKTWAGIWKTRGE